MIDDLELIKRARPGVTGPREQARTRARSALEQSIAGRPGRRPDRRRWFDPGAGALALALSVGVVAVVVGVFVGLRSNHQITAGSSRGPLQLVFRAAPSAPHPTTSALQRTEAIIRTRLASVVPAATVSLDHNELIVRIPRSPLVRVANVKSLVERSDELSFFDWEANVLAPTGQLVSGLLRADSPSAIAISQGTTNGPGAPGARSLSLYDAVKLAARQQAYVSGRNSRKGPEYFMFGKPGSVACDTPAEAGALRSGPCYLAGPARTRSQLDAQLPKSIAPSGAQIIKINRGWEVVEAAYPAYHWPPISDPSAQFFAVRDQSAVWGGEITNPHPGTDPAGLPDVSFGFTAKGAAHFQNLTAAIAKRSEQTTPLGRALYQHFAVVLGTRLVTIPYINFTANPFGIPGNSGAEIQGGFTRGTARRLAANIAPLPVRLTLVSTR